MSKRTQYHGRTASGRRVGRSVATICFDCQWKAMDEARETDEDNEKPETARRKPDGPRGAPPLTVVERGQAPEGKAAHAAQIMREAVYGE